MSLSDTVWLRGLAVVLLGGGAATLLFTIVKRHVSFLRGRLAAHARMLARDLTFLRMEHTPRQVILGQAVGLAATGMSVLLGWWLLASVLVVLVCAPKPWLEVRRAKRVNAMDGQLEGWLQGLASSLRATPALGEALEFSMSLVSPPLRDELDVLIKEQRLGTPLDEALTRMGERIASRSVNSALGALRIGRSMGGDLASILERTAATLREMTRLEGVVRTKTAEGKAQAYVVAVLPFPMIGLFTYLSPTLLLPLVESFRGYCVAGGAFVLWLSSIVIARKILHVDL